MVSVARFDDKTGICWADSIPSKTPFNELSDGEKFGRVLWSIEDKIRGLLTDTQEKKNEESLTTKLKQLLQAHPRNGTKNPTIQIEKNFANFRDNTISTIISNAEKEFPTANLSFKQWSDLKERAIRFFDSEHKDTIGLTLLALLPS